MKGCSLKGRLSGGVAGLLAMLLLMISPPASAEGLSDQALVYLNARMALRGERPREVVKLWLLRNAVASRTGEVSAQDADLRSVTWAALGRLGVCPDGFERDGEGAGLWPLALHNWTLANRRGDVSGGLASPFDAFELGRQQRHVSLLDVLDASELETFRLVKTPCWYRHQLLVDSGQGITAEWLDRRTIARVLRHTLRTARHTLARDGRIRGRGVLLARIFDINLRLAGLTDRAGRRARRRARSTARERGLSKAEMAQQAEGDPPLVDPLSEEGRILMGSLKWPAADWMALSAQRRQYLFSHARAALRSSERRSAAMPLVLGIVDALIRAGEGTELESWLGHLEAMGASREIIWAASRGRRLLSLDERSGFKERGIIALHRGVAFLGAGRRAEAIRAFAQALAWSETSSRADELRSLARRWLSFVAAQYRVNDALLETLRATVPRSDFAEILEDQLWHAALAADEGSFERCLRHQRGRGALKDRAELLRPLARGDGGAFRTQIINLWADSPYFVTRFATQLVARLETQDAGIRQRHRPTLEDLRELLMGTLAEQAARGRRQRRLDVLLDRVRALLEGLDGLVAGGDAARALSPHHEIFAGSLRLAPSDPLPWPFRVRQVRAPSVFTPLILRPVEWRDDEGALVFGWQVEDP